MPSEAFNKLLDACRAAGATVVDVGNDEFHVDLHCPHAVLHGMVLRPRRLSAIDIEELIEFLPPNIRDVANGTDCTCVSDEPALSGQAVSP